MTTELNWPNAAYNSGALTDAEYEQLVIPYMTDGVFGKTSDTSLVFGDGSGRNVKIRSGKVVQLRGQRYSSGATNTTLTITANSSGSDRFDLIVLRWTRSGTTVRAAVVTGTPGSGPPSPTQDISTTGTYELPLATVEVVNGATTINDSSVTRVYYFLSPQPLVCTSTTRPPHAPGRIIFETDTGRSLTSNGSSWTNPVEDTGWVEFSTASGWTKTTAQVRRVNNIVYLRFEAVRSGADLASGTDSLMGTIPTAYQPAGTLQVLGYFDGANLARSTITADGKITLNNYGAITVSGSKSGKDLDVKDGQPFPKGSTLTIQQTTSWPLG